MEQFIIFFFFIAFLNTFKSQTLGPEQIINGNFSQNNCTSNNCISNSSNLVRQWIPDPEIEIGKGSIYNSNFGSEWMIQLTGNKNGCIKQTITALEAGIYQLKYNFTARQKNVFENCRFTVQFNSKQLREVTPFSNDFTEDTVEISIYNTTVGEVRFCSIGIFNDSLGAILKSVSLRKSLDLHVQSQVFNSQKLILDSHSEKVFEREYEFGNGPIEIFFNYIIVTTVLARRSYLSVKFDGKQIYQVKPCQGGKDIRISVPRSLIKGVYNLSFAAVGNPDEGHHKILIQNIFVDQIQCQESQSGNLMINGGFEDNKCTNNDYCIYNSANLSNNVPGWIPNLQLEIGRPAFYNTNWVNATKVAELDGRSNTCIKQKITLQSGRLATKFYYAAQETHALNSNWFKVRLNGKDIIEIKPPDYKLYNTTVNMELAAPPVSQIQFCGTGVSDGYGITVSNIQLYSYDRCSSTKIVSY